jgi:hypothetical protein
MTNKYMNIPDHQGNKTKKIRFHLTYIRMAIIRIQTRTNAGKYMEVKEIFIHCLFECKLVQPPWKTAWRFLEKLKIQLPHDLALPLIGICLKECKSGYNRHTYTPIFIAALSIIAKLSNHSRCPSLNECMKKMSII